MSVVRVPGTDGAREDQKRNENVLSEEHEKQHEKEWSVQHCYVIDDIDTTGRDRAFDEREMFFHGVLSVDFEIVEIVVAEAYEIEYQGD